MTRMLKLSSRAKTMLQAKTRKWLGLFLTVEQGSILHLNYLSSPYSAMFLEIKDLSMLGISAGTFRSTSMVVVET